MKTIFAITKITFLELLRERLVFISFLLSLCLFGLSILLGTLTFDEKVRVLTHFGLSAIHLCLIVVASFVGATFINKEISRQTCLIVLARPVSRAQYLTGKFFGITLLLKIMWLILSLCLFLLLYKDLPDLGLFFALFGLLLEAILLLAIAIAASTFLRPAISILFVFGVYLAGHWLQDLQFFAKKSESPEFIFFAKVLNWVMPHLENLNWRSVSLIQGGLQASMVGWALVHTLAWVVLAISFSYLMFRRKDLV